MKSIYFSETMASTNILQIAASPRATTIDVDRSGCDRGTEVGLAADSRDGPAQGRGSSRWSSSVSSPWSSGD